MAKFALSTTSKRALAAACALCATIALASCGSTKQSKQSSSTSNNGIMRVAYLSTANYLTTLKNDDFAQKEFDKSTVKFTGPYTPLDAYAAVNSGAADASSTGTTRFIDWASKNQPWVAFAIEYYNGDSQGIVAAPNSGIKTLKDLYGKKIGIIAKGGTGDYVIHRSFEKAGLDPSKVQEVEMSPKNFHAAFTTGQVDALATFDQNLAAALATPGSKRIVNAKDYGNLNVSIHMVSASFAKKHPDLVKKMYRALVKEAQKAKKNPSVITNAYKEFGASESTLKEVAKFYVPDILPIDEKGREMLRKQAEQEVRYGFIKSVPDFTKSTIDCTK
ncbi:ABC transporter substrate-binding protein [Gardnerella pickettii]|uniref:ABC transporter substrate-binding protein n=1 Tax=Gardnerella pickettii TaxID=2914924 RepID=UPI0003547037|nr:NMT1/THI5-like protein [Gardnerella vaginalis JCP8151B]